MDAFAELFEPLRPKVFAAAVRLVGAQDAEDVVMDTFLRAWKALPGFRGGSSLQTWLLRIARNRALDVLRARRAEPFRFELDAPVEPDAPAREIADRGQPDPAERAADRIDAGRARTALKAMDEPHRRVLELRYEDDMSYAEIAATLGVRIGTVMSRLFHARRKLARAVEPAAAAPEDPS